MIKHPGGRPRVPNPKMHDIKVRVDEDMYQRIIEYATEHSITTAETVRRAIEVLLPTNGIQERHEQVKPLNSITELHNDSLTEDEIMKIRRLLETL